MKEARKLSSSLLAILAKITDQASDANRKETREFLRLLNKAGELEQELSSFDLSLSTEERQKEVEDAIGPL